MANLNKVMLIGRLTRDPELRYTPSGLAVAEMGLAVNHYRRGQDGARQEETAFVDLTSFGRTAELAGQYLAKGRQVFVDGHLRFEQWTNKEGQKRSKLGVVVDNLQFLDPRGEGGGQGMPPKGEQDFGAETGRREDIQQDGGPGPDDFSGPADDGPPQGDQIPF